MEWINICLTGNWCKITDSNWIVSWEWLQPWTYELTEDLGSSNIVWLIPTTPVSVTVILNSWEDQTEVQFWNAWQCWNWLTPWFWKNWNNHYKRGEFNTLLQWTIAVNVKAADKIFSSYSASNPQDLTILKAFVLSNQLTINLAQNPSLSNPSNWSYYVGCVGESTYWVNTLGEILEQAIQIINWYVIASDAEILRIKNILDKFANYKII